MFLEKSVLKICSSRRAPMLKCNFRPEACNFIKKKTLAQVFSCEFCEISKNTFSYKTPLVAASFCKKSVFKNVAKFTGKKHSWSLYFVIKKRLWQLWETFKNRFFTKYHRETASDLLLNTDKHWNKRDWWQKMNEIIIKYTNIPCG